MMTTGTRTVVLDYFGQLTSSSSMPLCLMLDSDR